MTVVWDVGTGKPLLTLGPGGDRREEGTGNPRLIAWAPDGQSLATVVDSFFRGSRIDIWDVTTGRKKQMISVGNLRIPAAPPPWPGARTGAVWPAPRRRRSRSSTWHYRSCR